MRDSATPQVGDLDLPLLRPFIEQALLANEHGSATGGMTAILPADVAIETLVKMALADVDHSRGRLDDPVSEAA